MSRVVTYVVFLLVLCGCDRKPTEEEAVAAERAKLEADIALHEPERVEANARLAVATESVEVMKLAKRLEPYISKDDAEWFSQDVAEIAYPPAQRTTADKLQRAKEVRSKFESELSRRR